MEIDSRDVSLSGVLAISKDVSGSVVVSTVTCTTKQPTGACAFQILPLGVYNAEETSLDGCISLDVLYINGGDLKSISVTLGSSRPLNSTGKDFVNERVWKICGGYYEGWSREQGHRRCCFGAVQCERNFDCKQHDDKS